MLWILVAIILFTVVGLVIGMYISAPKYEGPETSNFDGKQFKNPSGASAHGFKNIAKWMLQRKQGPWERVKNTGNGLPPPESSQNIRVTFINHSSFLIQVDGVNILTDPIYSDRASPFSWIGPERMHPVGIRFDDLPIIHYVLISHNHYDHLDEATVKRLNDRFQPMFVIPLGVDKFMQKLNIDKVVSLDWWQEMPLKEQFSVACVPAQHFSGRGLLDRDATLWCGYVLKTTFGNIYFAGDTGYDQAIFKEIGRSFEPIQLSLIPIGAYKPEWFMSPVHISPMEAIKVHQDLNSQQSIAIHFGTFPLGDDGQHEAVDELQKALQAYNIPSRKFWVLNEGEGRSLEWLSK